MSSKPEINNHLEKKQEDATRIKRERFTRQVDSVMAALSDATVQEALTILTSLVGQLVAQLAKGTPGALKPHLDNIVQQMHKAALNKIMYDDQRRREARMGDEEQA